MVAAGRAPDPGPDWVALPSWRSPRWYLPREPAENTRTSLLVYHPITRRSRVGWEVARVLAARGLLGLRRGLPLVPNEVWEASAHLIPEGGGLAVARANHPGRFVSLVVGDKGQLRAFVKVARDSVGAEALVRERMAIERWGPLLSPPLYAPRVLDHRHGALILEPVEWLARMSPWRMDNDVAHALGGFFHMTVSQRTPLLGVAHRDCAPWNLLRTRSGWALIDWENAEEGRPPFFDLFTFFVQSTGELGRPTKRALMDGLELSGPVGESMKAYAAGAGLDPLEAKPLFREYLERSSAELTPSDSPRELRIRRLLARRMEL
jgi:hypothetical protein